jgi:hypothetical protein
VAGAAAALTVCVSALAAQAAPRQVSASDAAAVATAINVRHADLASFAQGPALTPSQLAQVHQLSAQLTRCYGGPPYGELFADVGSPAFTAGTGAGATVIGSETEIFPSAALAAEDLAAAARPRGLACLLSVWRALIGLTAPAGEVVRGAVSRIAQTVAGTGVAVAIRMTFSAEPSGSFTTASAVIGRVDTFAFVRGQAEGSLSVQTQGAVPDAATERRLCQLLVARARAAIG